MDRIVTFLDDRIQSSMGSYLAGVAAATVVCVPTTYFLYGRYMRAKMNQRIQARRQKTQDNLKALRDDLVKHADMIDENLAHLSFEDLQRGLQDGTITATAALRAYQATALEVNDEINAITDVLEDAKAIASRLDSLPASERGPLHGVPISLKEACKIKGHDRTSGFGELIDVPCEDDCVIVKVLKAKGAVPFIRTNLPQGMRSSATANPIYGRTLNPHNTTRSPGGSSGGEGAIIGGNGSILGVGSDIAGSIRIPACYCGTFALKPTAGRLSLDGKFDHGSLEGQSLVRSTDGPLGRDVDSLVQFMEAVLCPEHFSLNPETPPIPFRREIYESRKPLKIGYYVYDDCIRCVPAVERGVMLAKATLEKLGHTLVEMKPYNAFYAFTKITMPACVEDDCEGHRELLKYDDSCGDMYNLFKFNQKSYLERWFLAKLEELKGYNPLVTEGMRQKHLKTLSNWFLRQNEAKKFRQEFARTWSEQGLDAVICPCMPHVAITAGVDSQFPPTVTYCSLYNVVNYPAGIVPVTKVTKSDVTKTMDPSIYNAETGIEKMIQADSEGTEGLPVGIQVVGRPYTEELVLRLMTELDGALKANAAE